MNSQDLKIKSTALRYIRKHSMNPDTWRFTKLEEAHPELTDRILLEKGECPVVSSYRSESSWYLLTTRRVISMVSGRECSIPTSEIRANFYVNFKGYKGLESEIMSLETAKGQEKLEFETGKASMAPIYYFRYWEIKYPILDKLKF